MRDEPMETCPNKRTGRMLLNEEGVKVNGEGIRVG